MNNENSEKSFCTKFENCDRFYQTTTLVPCIGNLHINNIKEVSKIRMDYSHQQQEHDNHHRLKQLHQHYTYPTTSSTATTILANAEDAMECFKAGPKTDIQVMDLSVTSYKKHYYQQYNVRESRVHDNDAKYYNLYHDYPASALNFSKNVKMEEPLQLDDLEKHSSGGSDDESLQQRTNCTENNFVVSILCYTL